MARRRLFQFPLSYVTDENWRHHVTAAFGQLANRWHNGVDFGADMGEPVYPIFDGRIHSWGTDHPVYGNWVVVEHDPASFSYYYHLQHRSNYDTGEPVQKHHVIGYVGTTGQSTGPHKHLGVSGRPDFTGFVDPVPYILERYWYDDGYSEPAPVPSTPVPVPDPVMPEPEIPPVEEPTEPTPAEPELVTLTVKQLAELTRPADVDGKRPPVPDWLAHAAYWTAGGVMVAAPLIFAQLALNGVVTGDYALQQVAILEAAAGSLAALTGVARFKRVKP